MPVPNEDQVGSYLDQGELDTGDITNIENVFQGYSVISGGAVTAQGTPNGTVAVAAGVAKVGNVAVTITAGNVSVISGSANPDGTTALAADATMARFSLITINSSGQLGVLHGTPAGLGPTNDQSYLDAFPTFASKAILASVRVLPTVTTVTTAQINDKRELHTDGDFIARAITPTALSADANNYAPTGFTTANVVRQATNNTSQRNISGLVPTGHIDGKQITWINPGPGPVAFLDESTNSTAANRFALPGDIVIPVDRSVEIFYDVTSSRWRSVGGQTASGAPSIILGTAAAPGATPYFIGDGSTIAAFDATVPVTQAFSDAPATGSAAFAARRDHRHGMPSASAVGSAGTSDYDEMFYGASINVSGSLIGKSVLTLSGTGAQYTAVPIASTPNHPGVGSLVTGTGTTGACYLNPATATQVSLGGGRSRFGAWVQVPTLSDGTNTFTCKVGFVEGTAVDGCFFLYGSAVNSGKWQANTYSNSVATTGDTAVTVGAGTWSFLEVEVNAAGTSAAFYVDKVLTNTITTNIPTGVGRETGVTLNILKSAGTTSRSLYIDAWYYELDFTTAR